MALKSWFRGRSAKTGKQGLTADDLINLRRYEEAEALLEARLRENSTDLHTRLKLADLHFRTGQRPKAVEEYLAIADGYAVDGFYDKALALLAKVARLVPSSEKVTQKIDRLRRAKRLEQRRSHVIGGLLRGPGSEQTTSVLEVQRLWEHLSGCHLVERLDQDQLGRLFRAFDMVHVEPDVELVRQGDSLEAILMVAEGRLAAVVELPNGTSTVMRELEPGDLVGDRALLEHKPWPASVRATQRSVVLQLTRSALENALQGNPDPRGLLEALRAQRLDGEIAGAATAAAQS